MEKVHVASVESFGAMDRKVVRIDNREIGVFRLDDGFVAWLNVCPHQGGPVCQGRFFKRVVEVMDSEKRFVRRDYDDGRTHLVCPWHGAEFDLRTGIHAGTKSMRLRQVDVVVEADNVFVCVP